MFNLSSIFGGGNTPQTAPVQPTSNPAPGQPLPGTQASQQTAVNGVVPAMQGDPNANGNTGNSDSSPLAPYSDIWQTANTANDTGTPLFANLDPAKVMESARKVNFSNAVSPEHLQAIAAGGEQAMKAFQESMNAVAQNVYAKSALATSKIVEQALSSAQERYTKDLPNMVKKFSANESILSENPIFNNPALQPLVGALQTQLIAKNPNATSAEIQQQTVDYFAALGTAFAPKPVQTRNSASRADEDWSKFI